MTHKKNYKNSGEQTLREKREDGGSGVTTDDGHIHVVELELPERRGVPRMLARSDRGDYPRSLVAWRKLLTDHFDEVVFEPFPVPSRGPALWRMVYFKGKPRTR